MQEKEKQASPARSTFKSRAPHGDKMIRKAEVADKSKSSRAGKAEKA